MDFEEDYTFAEEPSVQSLIRRLDELSTSLDPDAPSVHTKSTSFVVPPKFNHKVELRCVTLDRDQLQLLATLQQVCEEWALSLSDIGIAFDKIGVRLLRFQRTAQREQAYRYTLTKKVLLAMLTILQNDETFVGMEKMAPILILNSFFQTQFMDIWDGEFSVQLHELDVVRSMCRGKRLRGEIYRGPRMRVTEIYKLSESNFQDERSEANADATLTREISHGRFAIHRGLVVLAANSVS